MSSQVQYFDRRFKSEDAIDILHKIIQSLKISTSCLITKEIPVFFSLSLPSDSSLYLKKTYRVALGRRYRYRMTSLSHRVADIWILDLMQNPQLVDKYWMVLKPPLRVAGNRLTVRNLPQMEHLVFHLKKIQVIIQSHSIVAKFIEKLL